MRWRNHRSLEISLLAIFVREVHPVGRIHASLELDAFAIHRCNFIADDVAISINTLAEEQVCKRKAVNTDI